MATKQRWDLALAGALGGAYWLALALGNGHTMFWTMAAFALVAPLFIAFAAQRRGWALTILSAAAVVPPATTIFLLLDDVGRPGSHPCNIGPVLALFALILAVAQVVAIAVIAGVLVAIQSKRAAR